MTSPLLANLNPEQLAAVTLPHASALILAGAGSGKTRVLTTRIAWLLATGQAGPLSILAVTFTNKAAREMLLRLSALTPVNIRGMWVGTFHGLCNRMLRAHHRDANLPQLFQILDTQDQLSLIKRMYRAHNIDDDRYPARQLQWFIANAKEEGLRANMVEAGDDFTRRQVEHYALYDEMCQREGAVDFAELLLRSYELLARNDALRGHYQRRFSHLLVDEFQDTNTLQYKWLRMLSGPHTAVFAVGDDDQSIYAFRGAKVANMQQFERDFATPGTTGKADQARTELPVARAHPRRGQRAHPQQPVTAGQESVDERRQGRARSRVCGAHRSRRGGVRRRCGQGTRGRRRRAGRSGPALSIERAIADPRTCVVRRRPSLSRLRRHALLRARRGQACARVSAPDRRPRGRRGFPAHREFSAARNWRAYARTIAGCSADAERDAVAGCGERRAHRQGRGGAGFASPG